MGGQVWFAANMACMARQHGPKLSTLVYTDRVPRTCTWPEPVSRRQVAARWHRYRKVPRFQGRLNSLGWPTHLVYTNLALTLSNISQATEKKPLKISRAPYPSTVPMHLGTERLGIPARKREYQEDLGSR